MRPASSSSERTTRRCSDASADRISGVLMRCTAITASNVSHRAAPATRPGTRECGAIDVCSIRSTRTPTSRRSCGVTAKAMAAPARCHAASSLCSAATITSNASARRCNCKTANEQAALPGSADVISAESSLSGVRRAASAHCANHNRRDGRLSGGRSAGNTPSYTPAPVARSRACNSAAVSQRVSADRYTTSSRRSPAGRCQPSRSCRRTHTRGQRESHCSSASDTSSTTYTYDAVPV